MPAYFIGSLNRAAQIHEAAYQEVPLQATDNDHRRRPPATAGRDLEA